MWCYLHSYWSSHLSNRCHSQSGSSVWHLDNVGCVFRITFPSFRLFNKSLLGDHSTSSICSIYSPSLSYLFWCWFVRRNIFHLGFALIYETSPLALNLCMLFSTASNLLWMSWLELVLLYPSMIMLMLFLRVFLLIMLLWF